MIKHTPGPWEIEEHYADDPYGDIRINGRYSTSGKPIRAVCRLWLDDAPVEDYNAEQHANARLIAAAPEMWEALNNISNCLVCAAISDPAEVCQTAFDMVQDAIAKVEGRKQ